MDTAGTAVNCTVVGNVATNGGGGVWNNGQLVNCIIYTNQVLNGNSTYQNWTNGTAPTYTNCCTWPTNNLPGSGNIEVDPMFVDQNSGNFRLKGASPCVNRGLNQDWMTNAVDLGSQPRIRYDIVDIGTYETIYQGTIFMGR